MELTSENVTRVFKDCLIKENEDLELLHVVEVEGVLNRFALHPDRLAAHAEEIKAMLNELPDEFRADVGGGWSFLNACLDKRGNQWTGLHLVAEQLVVLGIAIGKVEYPVPKPFWDILPGGMPYFRVIA